MTTTSSDQTKDPKPRDGDSGRANDSPPDERGKKKRRIPRGPLWGNVLTMIGGFVSIIAVILLMTFMLFSVVSPATNPYVDIVGYMVLPGLLIIGLILMPAGILFKSWRVKRRDPTQRLSLRFRFDLTEPGQRKLATVIIGSTFVFLPVIGVSSYHGYHYTDSTEFCGKACHAVMKPEATTHALSPHARVTCAECHIGEGAGWFVKSKLSGTRQVLAMWTKSYSRPIPPAIRHLRPARDTCERCHWPQKFYGAQLEHLPHYAPDEANTDRSVDMLLNIGGGHHLTGKVEGIHWHMALANKVEYVSTDAKLQVVPWVRVVDRYDRVRIYRADGRPSSDPPPEGERRHFDCMDCHNRPAHNFLPPDEAVDRMLDAGLIDPSLPFIKREAVNALIAGYADSETAAKQIGGRLEKFYREKYPDLWRNDAKRVTINRAIDGVREIYSNYFFPYMRVSWKTYPDNIGHMNSPGCFRCHDNRHVDQFGKTLDMNCTSCHTFLTRTVSDDGVTDFRSAKTYDHPWKRIGVHQTLICSQCHSGGALPVPSCKGCHTDTAGLRAGTLAAFKPYDIEPDPMFAAEVDCETCHDGAPPVKLETMNDTCTGCHDDDSYNGMAQRWHDEMNKAIDNLMPRLSGEPLEVLETLKKAGPSHNIEASRKILKALAAGTSTADAAPASDDKSESYEGGKH